MLWTWSGTDMTCNEVTKTELDDFLPESLRCRNVSQLTKALIAGLIDKLERHKPWPRPRRSYPNPRWPTRSLV